MASRAEASLARAQVFSIETMARFIQKSKPSGRFMVSGLGWNQTRELLWRTCSRDAGRNTSVILLESAGHENWTCQPFGCLLYETHVPFCVPVCQGPLPHTVPHLLLWEPGGSKAMHALIYPDMDQNAGWSSISVGSFSETVLVLIGSRVLVTQISENCPALPHLFPQQFSDELFFTGKEIHVRHQFCIWVGKEPILTSRSCDISAFILLFIHCIYVHFLLSSHGYSTAHVCVVHLILWETELKIFPYWISVRWLASCFLMKKWRSIFSNADLNFSYNLLLTIRL